MKKALSLAKWGAAVAIAAAIGLAVLKRVAPDLKAKYL